MFELVIEELKDDGNVKLMIIRTRAEKPDVPPVVLGEVFSLLLPPGVTADFKLLFSKDDVAFYLARVSGADMAQLHAILKPIINEDTTSTLGDKILANLNTSRPEGTGGLEGHIGRG